MKTIKVSGEFFNVKDTLECGQTFRFKPYEKGFLVNALDKCAYAYNDGDFAYIQCEDGEQDFFYNYFDLSRDYLAVYNAALDEKVEILTKAATLGKGIRILNQDPEEMLFSFIVSQNNNIPRIKGIIERLCLAIGEKKNFDGKEYYSFPNAKAISEKPLEFFSSVGLGYRAAYIKRLGEEINGGLDVKSFSSLSTGELKQKLVSLYGVGPKVADCALLFGFHRSNSFPVDTWIEKVYFEDFKGKEKNRNKITSYFTDRFKENSGYFQQYLFYYKRSLEKN